MSWKLWIVGVVLVIVNSPIFAKPADLPVDQRINTAGDKEKIPTPNPPPAIGVLIQSLPVDQFFPIQGSPLPWTDEASAVEAFSRAESHRQKGRIGEARRGYQETHLLAPTSAFGRLAIQRLREIDAPGNDFFEEQEPPLGSTSLRPANDTVRPLNQPKPTREEYREMLRQTQPLGGIRTPREAY